MAFPTRSTLCAAALCLVLGSPAAHAEFPERAITMVVPTAAGGGNDTLARVIGQKMGELLGQTVIVVNKPGAQGAIAADYVARQPADGYTLTVSYTHLDVYKRQVLPPASTCGCRCRWLPSGRW